MKRSILLTFCVAFLCFVQINVAQSYKPIKRYKKKSTTATYNKIVENPNDSAVIYYKLGWEAYKSSDFGSARYYWELGSNVDSNTPSKYSCAFRLGLMHQEGEGIGVNLQTAFYYYNFAYANGQRVGNVDATKNIASYFENGLYVSKDKATALEWYLKAKAQGNKYCNADIARMKKSLAKGWLD